MSRISIKELKPILKNKWLDYYEANRSWLEKLDGYKQKISDPWFILGIITALEPKSELKDLLLYFLLVTKDCKEIVRELELDFDPQIELEFRAMERAFTQQAETELDKIKEENLFNDCSRRTDNTEF